MHRIAAALLSIASVAATLTATAATTPTMLPDGTWARAPHRGIAPASEGTLRAGAATGDITTPPGAPPTGFYVARHCGTSTGLEAVGKMQDKLRQVQEDPTEAPYAPSQCTAPRLGPDTDGYAKTFPASDGRFGRLRAQAFVIDDGARKVAIVSVDLPGFFGEMHEAVAERIADIGIPRENLLVSASHTHTGPGGYFQQNLGWAALGGDILDPRLFEVITSGIVFAIREANGALRPAKLAEGEAILDGHNGNRRGSQWQLNPEATLGIDPRNAPRLGMIRIDGTDGVPIGVITNYSSHGTIGNTINMWHTADDKGWVGRLVERGIRADSGLPPGTPIVATTLNGAQGDIGSAGCSRHWPNMGGADFNDFMCMEHAGARQAVRYLEVWRALGAQLSSDVTVDARFDMVCFCGQEVADDPYDPFDRGEYVPANDDPKYFSVSNIAIQGEGKAPATIFPGHHRRTPLLIGPPGLSPKNVRIQVLRVGRTAYATMPGEPTITMGRRVERSVKAALGGLVDRVWTAGLANDHNAYYATIQEYEAYQYEGGWSFYGQQSGNLLKLRLVQLAEWMALGQDEAECTLERQCLENPDTTDLTAEPEPIVHDVLAGTVHAQPQSVERFEGTRFSWIGGGPSNETGPARGSIVSLERLVGPDDWQIVMSDVDPEIPLRYWKRYGMHRYSALFDPTAETPAGTYRFVVVGKRHDPVAPDVYRLESDPFTLSTSTKLGLVKDNDGVWRVGNPSPDRLRNFRFRPLHPATWTVTGTLNGAPFSASAPFTLATGDQLVVPAGGLVDGHTNTNGAEITVTG